MKPAKSKDEISNPISETLEELSRPTFVLIEEAVDAVTVVVHLDRDWPHGYVHAEPGEDACDLGFRRATNLECSMIDVDWIQAGATLDLRKNLPKQVAKWLRSMAAKIIASADAVDSVTDDRNLKEIKAIVSGTMPAVSMSKAGAA